VLETACRHLDDDHLLKLAGGGGVAADLLVNTPSRALKAEELAFIRHLAASTIPREPAA